MTVPFPAQSENDRLIPSTVRERDCFISSTVREWLSHSQHSQRMTVSFPVQSENETVSFPVQSENETVSIPAQSENETVPFPENKMGTQWLLTCVAPTAEEESGCSLENCHNPQTEGKQEYSHPHEWHQINPGETLASFPGLPRFHSSVCVQYNTRKWNYIERKPKNEDRGGLGKRLGRLWVQRKKVVLMCHSPQVASQQGSCLFMHEKESVYEVSP